MHGECDLGSVGQDSWYRMIEDMYWSTCEWKENTEWCPVVLPKLGISWILRSAIQLLSIWHLLWCWLTILVIKTKLCSENLQFINMLIKLLLKSEIFIMENLQTWRTWEITECGKHLLGCALNQFCYWLASRAIGQNPNTSVISPPVKWMVHIWGWSFFLKWIGSSHLCI